jgi:exonuclease VII small subunit
MEQKIKAQAASSSFRREDRIREHLEAARQQVESLSKPDSEELSQRAIQARNRASRDKQQRLEQARKELEQLQQTPSGIRKRPDSRQ